MDGTNECLHKKVVALSAFDLAPRRSSNGTTPRPHEDFRYDLLLKCPPEIRYKIYEQQLEIPLSRVETEVGPEHASEAFYINAPRLSGYYRPFVAAIHMVHMEIPDWIYDLDYVRVAMLSLHPPLMTLDAADPSKQEAFAFYLRTKLAVELRSETCIDALTSWANRIPPTMLASMSLLHVVFQNRVCCKGVRQQVDELHCWEGRFRSQQGTTLPTFRIEVINGARTIAIRGHCALSADCMRQFNAAIDEWRNSRTGSALFDGRDLVNIAQRLARVRASWTGELWDFNAGTVFFTDEQAYDKPGHFGSFADAVLYRNRKDEHDWGFTGDVFMRKEETLEEFRWNVTTSPNLRSVSFAGMVPETIFGVHMVQIDALRAVAA